jgi:inorganic pyrophosphatase
MASLAPEVVLVMIPLSAVLGIIFALWLWKRVSAVSMSSGGAFRGGGREYLLEEEQRGDEEVRRAGLR